MTRTVVDPIEHRAPIEALLANHQAFVRDLERRVGDRALAEDILQDAFAKIVARPEQTPADEGVVPWFYSTLRNAAIDQFRRRGAAHRAYEAFARELETHDAPSDDMLNGICACVSRLAATLKPEYAEALTARGWRNAGKGIYGTEGAVFEQCRRSRVPRTGSSQEAGGGVVRNVRRTRLRELHVQTTALGLMFAFSGRSAGRE